MLWTERKQSPLILKLETYSDDNRVWQEPGNKMVCLPGFMAGYYKATVQAEFGQGHILSCKNTELGTHCSNHPWP